MLDDIGVVVLNGPAASGFAHLAKRCTDRVALDNAFADGAIEAHESISGDGVTVADSSSGLADTHREDLHAAVGG